MSKQDGIVAHKNVYQSEKSNLHQGHRMRVKQRYLDVGIEGFQDHEILEMILFWIIPRGDTNEIAHNLLRKFGSMNNVFRASKESLMRVKGVKEQTALYLKFWYDVFCRYEKAAITSDALPSHEERERDILTFLFKCFYGATEERIVVLCLDEAGRMINDFTIHRGLSNALDVTYAEIIREIAIRGADYVAISHNHPSGLLVPSNEDLVFTHTLAAKLDSIGVELITHYLIAGKSYMKISSNYQTYQGVGDYDFDTIFAEK